jgi:hypothetical protein
MSDDYVYVIPSEPGLVPDEASGHSTVRYFRSIAPRAGEITVFVSDHLEFIHCGGNFGKILCPSCGASIGLESWQDWMNKDFQGRGKGFTLSRRALPCCGVHSSLHDLNYEWPQGFARFNVCAQNPGIGKLSGKQRRRFEQILGCPVRVIYEHR